MTGYDYLKAGLRHMREIDGETEMRRAAERMAASERQQAANAATPPRLRAGQAE